MSGKWLFIHGGWGGSWQWTPLRDRLLNRGIHSIAPDMPGMGSSGAGGITLDHFIETGSAIIESENEPVNLAAFSFGGMTATALAGKHPGKIKKLVYIDAFVPMPGQAFSHIAGEKITRQIRAYSEVMGECDMIPPFFETDSRYCSHPLGTLFSEIDYRESDLEQLRPVYIECTAKDPQWTFTPLLDRTARFLEQRGWTVHSVESDHMPMYSHTEEILNFLDL